MRGTATIILSLLVAALAACGQKGPLVLPPTPAAPQSTPPAGERPYPGVPATTEKK